MKRTALKVLAATLLFGPAVWGQDDEPGRGVARLSLINGDVSVRRGDSGDWVAAAVNAPLVVEDHVLTGSGSRAEIQFDWANMLRLAPNTDVRLASLENNRYQAQIANGMVTLSVLRDSNADVEIDTPNVSVRPVKKGEYRITVLENGESEVTVRSGEVEVYTPRGVERVRSGRTMLVRGTQADPEYQIVDAASRDEWDRWNEERDQRLERSKGYAYASRDIYGVDDLDAYGRWVYAPPYGWVWTPYGVGAGWAPYRDGRWAWVDYYGWTWVGYEPWGWAPYHYGRWFHRAPYGWCWYPGGRYSRHFWRPALVAFFGFDAGPVHIGIGFGNVGWVPLAPYEPFHPWYGRHIYRGYRSGAYIDNSVRIVNNTNIINVYRNARVHGATGIGHDDFARGRRGHALAGDEVRIRNANLVQGALPMTPTRESQRLSDREVRMPQARRNAQPERFFTRNQPRQVERVSFEDQRRGMENLTQRAFGNRTGRPEQGAPAAGWRGTGDQQRPGAPAAAARPGEGTARPRAAEQAGGGWRRVGERPAEKAGRPGDANAGWRGTANRPAPERSAEPNRESGEGWRRFGGRPAEANQGGARQSEGNAPAERKNEGAARGRSDTVRRDFGATERSSGEGWTRFGAGGGEASRSEPRQIEQRSEPRYEAPQWSRPERSEAPRWSGGGSREPVRINPPIVRERGGDFGRGGGMSAPRGGEARGGGMSTPRGGGESRGGGGQSRGGGSSRNEGGGGRGRNR